MSVILQSVLVAAGTGVSTKESQTRPNLATDKDTEDTSKQTKLRTRAINPCTQREQLMTNAVEKKKKVRLDPYCD